MLCSKEFRQIGLPWGLRKTPKLKIMKKNSSVLKNLTTLEGGDLLLKALNKGLDNSIQAGSTLTQPELVVTLKEFEGHSYYTLGLKAGGIYFPLRLIAEGDIWATPKRGGSLRKSGRYASQIVINGEDCTPRALRELLLGCYAEEIKTLGLPSQDGEGAKKVYALNKGVNLSLTVDKLSTVSTLGFVARGERPTVDDIKDTEVSDLSVKITEEEEE